LLHAREYQAEGNQIVQPWIDSTLAVLTTCTGMAIAKTAQDLSPCIWWVSSQPPSAPGRHGAWPATRQARSRSRSLYKLQREPVNTLSIMDAISLRCRYYLLKPIEDRALG